MKGQIAPAALICLKPCGFSEAPGHTALRGGEKYIGSVPHPAIKSQQNGQKSNARSQRRAKQFHLCCQ